LEVPLGFLVGPGAMGRAGRRAGRRDGLWFSSRKELLQLLEMEEFVSDALEEGVPIARCVLPEEAHGGIPGGGIALEPPAPFGEVLEEEPGGSAHATGEMGEGGVGGDDEIAAGEDGGGIEEIPGLVDLVLDVDEAVSEGAGVELLGAGSLLEGEEGDVGAEGEGREGFEGKGSPASGGGFVGRVSLPGDGDEGPGCLGEALLPVLESLGSGVDVGVCVEGVVGADAEEPRKGEEGKPGARVIGVGLVGMEGVGIDGGGAEDAVELALGGESNGDALALEGQDVAHELEGVAEALFADEEEGLMGV
jgi:hypothetical protein